MTELKLRIVELEAKCEMADRKAKQAIAAHRENEKKVKEKEEMIQKQKARLQQAEKRAAGAERKLKNLIRESSANSGAFEKMKKEKESWEQKAENQERKYKGAIAKLRIAEQKAAKAQQAGTEERLENQVSSLEAKLKSTLAKWRAAEKKVQLLEQKAASASQQGQGNASKLEEQNIKIKALHQQTSEARRRADRLDAENKVLEQKVIDLEKDVKSQRNKAMAAFSGSAGIDKLKHQMHESLERAEAKADKAEIARKGAIAKLQASERRALQLEQKVAASDDKLNKVEASLHKVTAQFKNAVEHAQLLESRLQSKGGAESSLSDRAEQQLRTIKGLREKYGSSIKKINDLEKKLAKVSEEKERFEERAEAAKRKMANISQMSQSQGASAEKAKQQMHDFENKLEAANQRVNTLKHRLGQASERAQKAESALAAAKESVERASVKADKAAGDVKTARAKVQKMQQDYDDLENKYLSVYKENIMLKSSQNYKI